MTSHHDDPLDDLLAGSAPATVSRTHELQGSLDALVAESEAAVAKRRRRLGHRFGIVGVATVGVLGLGAAAGATGLVSLPWFDDPDANHDSLVLRSGTSCEVTFAARELRDQNHPVSRADRLEAVAAAEAFLQGFDLDDIDVARAVARYEAADAAYRSSEEFLALPEDERPPEESPDEVELAALQSELSARLATRLERQGLSTYAVGVAGAFDCDAEADAR